MHRPLSALSSDAVDDAIPVELALIIKAWPMLPEDARGAMLAIAREAMLAEVVTESAVDQAEAGPFSAR
tara:strand:- start:126575 stop:126781 length:207 start_codon:yes stop_codon:yes gene_type:complete